MGKTRSSKVSSKGKPPGGKAKQKKQQRNGKKASSTKSSNSYYLHILIAVAALFAGWLSPKLWVSLGDGKDAERIVSEVSTHYTCDPSTLSNYLHTFAVPGMHVACLQAGKWTLYKDALVVDHPKSFPSENIRDWASLQEQLVANLDLQTTDDLHQPWATFTPAGERLRDEVSDGGSAIDEYNDLGAFLVLQGGQWVWPGIKKGYQRVIQLDDTRNATLETLSLHPLVLSVHGFLSEEECDWIQEAAAPNMQYSKVTLMDKDQGRPASDFRTSQTGFLTKNTKETREIEKRTARLIRMPTSHQEPAQVLRYGRSEKYDAHHDYFDPSLYQRDERTLQRIQNGRRNRMATVFWYLSNVEKGGETVFPRVDKMPHPEIERACELGLKVKPEKGKVIIFYSMTADGQTDTYSLHGACPVEEGTKWAANKWVWNLPR